MTAAEAFHQALNSGDFDDYRRWLDAAQQAVLTERVELAQSPDGSTTWTALVTFPPATSDREAA
jgi:hypothetical protein